MGWLVNGEETGGRGVLSRLTKIGQFNVQDCRLPKRNMRCCPSSQVAVPCSLQLKVLLFLLIEYQNDKRQGSSIFSKVAKLPKNRE